MGKTTTAAPTAVVDYRASWNVRTNYGSITITLQRGRPFTLERIESHIEFIAILTLLQGEKTVFFQRPNTLTTML